MNFSCTKIWAHGKWGCYLINNNLFLWYLAEPLTQSWYSIHVCQKEITCHSQGKQVERNNFSLHIKHTIFFTLSKVFHNNKNMFGQFLSCSSSFLIQNTPESCKGYSSEMFLKSGLWPSHQSWGHRPNPPALQSQCPTSLPPRPIFIPLHKTTPWHADPNSSLFDI